MNKLRKNLEVLKSWGIESVSVDKVLSMIDEVDGNEDVITGEDHVRASYSPCKEESEVDAFFKGVTSISITTHHVGGTIFYIDDKADGIYEFFDADGNLIKDIKVGDKPYYYRVLEKGAKDKYYVYHDEMHTAKRWTYLKDESFVYDAINLLGKGIGKGKTNTEIMMARDNGAYVTANSSGCPTIWYQLQRARGTKVGGCNDWFVPSKGEAEALRLAIKSGSIIGGEIAGASYKESIFSKSGGYYIWSSSEYSSQYAWYWSYGGQNWSNSSKDGGLSVFFARAF